MAHRALEQFCRKNVELGADQPLKAVRRDYPAILFRPWKIGVLKKCGHGGSVDEISERSKGSAGVWASIYSRGNDSKSLATFCLFPENLSVAGYRRNGLICMVEESPMQGSILAVSRPSLV